MQHRTGRAGVDSRELTDAAGFAVTLIMSANMATAVQMQLEPQSSQACGTQLQTHDCTPQQMHCRAAPRFTTGMTHARVGGGRGDGGASTHMQRMLRPAGRV